MIKKISKTVAAWIFLSPMKLVTFLLKLTILKSKILSINGNQLQIYKIYKILSAKNFNPKILKEDVIFRTLFSKVIALAELELQLIRI